MKEFYSERDLDAIGFFSREHRRRLRKKGKLAPPMKFGGPRSKNHYSREYIDGLKALAASPTEETAA